MKLMDKLRSADKVARVNFCAADAVASGAYAAINKIHASGADAEAYAAARVCRSAKRCNTRLCDVCCDSAERGRFRTDSSQDQKSERGKAVNRYDAKQVDQWRL